MTTPTLRRLLALSLTAALATTTHAQTLARPGWVGNGINTDVWWKNAIVYEVNPLNFNPTGGSGLHGIAQRLEYIQSLGADVILLTTIQPDAAHAQSIDPAYGTLDDLDDLIHEASRHNVRVMLDLDPNIPSADLPNVARFWLNRGIAGFHVPGTTPEARAQAAELRKATNTYMGQRILIADVDPQQHTKASDAPPAQLLLDASLGAVTPLNPAAVRAAVESTESIAQAAHNLPLLASDGPGFKRSMIGSLRPAYACLVSQKILLISSIFCSSSSALATSTVPLVPAAPASLVASLNSWCSCGYFSKCGGLK